jgi:hypothetical protein
LASATPAPKKGAEEENIMNTSTTMEASTELVPASPDTIEPGPAMPLTLFGNDPQLALRRMSELATALIDVVRDRKLSVTIQGREHLTAEAWTCLGGLVGLVPVVTWTRRLEDGSGWEARVEARTLDGRVVGAAESMCSRAEKQWARRDDFQLRSMSQTRAIGRALRAPLSPIAVLADYEPAGAEELTDTSKPTARAQPGELSAAVPPEAQPTDDQIDQLRTLVDRLRDAKPDEDWTARCRHLAGVPGYMLTRGGADGLIRRL